MPDGSAELVPASWQPLPGVTGAEIYPYVRKIDNISSNSYLIRTPDAILLIDPGGLAEQAAMLARLIAECREMGKRPVYVLLTHVHIDHFVGIQHIPVFAYKDTVVVMVHEAGARALERGDQSLTAAEMLSTNLSPMNVGVHLFQEERVLSGRTVHRALNNGGRISTAPVPGIPYGEQIQIGTSLLAECFHTPGHSPDSICIRIGSILFIGDILFAASPGVAGIPGWSQKALIQSLGNLEQLLSEGGVTIICPGHGRLIETGDARAMTATVKKEALTLNGIATLTRDRTVEAAAFAEDCMEQVNELFTIMAGRLHYVAYVLDELGEAGVAENTGTLMNSDTVDELLEAFRSFSEEHRQGRRLSIHLALKASQVIGKLERVFRRSDLAQIIDPSLILRAERLLADYTTMFRGYSPPREITRTDLISLLNALIEGLTIPPCSDDDVLASADDDAAFTAILMARIGARPLLEDVGFRIGERPEHLAVLIDRILFTDLLTYLFEDLVGTGSDMICLDIETSENTTALLLTGTCSRGDSCAVRVKRFLYGLSERAGGSLDCEKVPDGIMYRIQITRATH